MSDQRPSLRLLTVVGARPNFMKVAPLLRAIEVSNRRRLDRPNIESVLVHTGQHYDHRMSETFFQELNIPDPDVHLGIGSGTHAEQVGRTMIAFESVLLEQKPDWVVVVGDVNATLACSITAKKLGVRVAHIEAGLRSFDESMPEEINRLVTDRLSDLLFTTEASASKNLLNEGVPEERISFVGNLMIDTLEAEREAAMALESRQIVLDNLREGSTTPVGPLVDDAFVLATIHRPSNTDDLSVFGPLVDWLVNEVAASQPVLWPVHPRAMKQLMALGVWEQLLAHSNLHVMEPVGYRQLLRLNAAARMVLTDSGGLQEECCVLGTPCVTMRMNTERPATLLENGGTSRLAGNRLADVQRAYRQASVQVRQPHRPNGWDGAAAERVVSAFTSRKQLGMQGAA